MNHLLAHSEEVSIQTVQALFTSADTMKILKISRATLQRWIASGKLPATKIGGQWRFRPEVLRELQSTGEVKPGEEQK